MPFLLQTRDIERVERECPLGVTSREIVRLFQSRGARLSEATFRKYVQAGLLPRSRRVGRKGKHTGLTGLYPTSTVRRIDLIKKMMAEGLTLQEIQDSFVAVKHRLEDVEGGWLDLVGQLEDRARTHPRRREVERDLARAEREMRSALHRIEKVGGRIAIVKRTIEEGVG